jgi:predicted esterase
MSSFTDPHAGQPVLVYGEGLDKAGAAMILVHGRGASTEDILSLAIELPQAGFAFLAPQAATSTWYPHRFTAPLEANQPWLDSALAALGRVVDHVDAAGIPPERTFLLGFSQGACLVLEYAARNARRYGGVIGLSGGLIGPEIEPFRYPASLAGTPVFLGCSDIDPHIAKARVVETARTLEQLGGAVDMRLYPGMGHTVNEDELQAVRAMLAGCQCKVEMSPILQSRNVPFDRDG